MVVIATDEKAYLLNPTGTTSLGRGSDNNISLPDLRSLSKAHAVFTVQSSEHQGDGVIVWLEDIKSTNGTYCGESPLEIRKISGKEKLRFGDFIRFGHSQKFFRLLEFPPVTANGQLPIELPKATSVSSTMPESFFPRNDFRLEEPQPFTTKRDADAHAFSGDKGLDGHFIRNTDIPLTVRPQIEDDFTVADRSARPGYSSSSRPAAAAPKERRTGDPKNMTISINYPTNGGNIQHPVSLFIDPPSSQANENAVDGYEDSGMRQRQHEYNGEAKPYQQQQAAYSSDEQQLFRGPVSPHDRAMMNRSAVSRYDDRSQRGGDVAAASNDFFPPRLYPEGGRPYASQRTARIPATAAWEERPAAAAAARGRFPGIDYNTQISRYSSNKGTSSYADRMLKQSTRGQQRNKQQQGADHQAAVDKTTAAAAGVASTTDPVIMRRLDLKSNGLELPMPFPNSNTEALAIDTILGQFVDRAAAVVVVSSSDSDPVPDPPDFVIAEVLAEESIDPQYSAVTNLNIAIGELNDLLRQAIAGADIDPSIGGGNGGNGIGADADASYEVQLDDVLRSVVASILQRAREATLSALDSSLVQALADASAKRGYPNNVGRAVETSLQRLDKLCDFHAEAEATQHIPANHVYAVMAHALSAILDDLDSAGIVISRAVASAEQKLQVYTDPDDEDNERPSRSRSLKHAALTSELEELRKLKSSLSASGLLGDDLARLRAQEKEAGIVESKLRRMVATIEENYLTKAFNIWKKQRKANKTSSSAAATATGGGEGVRSAAGATVEILRLRGQVCDLTAKIHELSNERETASALLAERALNRELSAMNTELRNGIQLLASRGSNASAGGGGQGGHLLELQEGLAQSRREAKLLNEEFEKLRNAVGPSAIEIAAAGKRSAAASSRAAMMEDKEEEEGGMDDTAVARHGQGGGGGVMTRNNSGTSGRSNTAPSSSNHRRSRSRRRRSDAESDDDDGNGNERDHYGDDNDGGNNAMVVARQKKSAGAGAEGVLSSRGGGRGGAGGGGGGGGGGTGGLPIQRLMLTKDDARKIVIQEVRRLKVSLLELQRAKTSLQDKLIAESVRCSQLSTSVQVLQGRITGADRAQVALRALLQQRIGEHAVYELAAALDAVSPGSGTVLRNNQDSI